MTEFTGLDLEMTFLEHYSEVLDVLDRTFNAVFDGLNQRFADELEAVRRQHPFKDLRYKYPCLRFTFAEAAALLRSHGPSKLQAELSLTSDPLARAHLEERVQSVREHGDLEDIGTEDEKLLGQIVSDVHGQDFYIIDKFPAHVRPFYTMPDPIDENLSNSYDIFIRGEEVRAERPPHLNVPQGQSLPPAEASCLSTHCPHPSCR
jgi:aspartyl-tRNA synthetase